ncbi:SPASM domain-containing protein [Sphingomonas sp. PB2P19]|uniref:radical SAM/SPASM domain-containing protein n=1 Tax=Sphingomonas rhamnosi TaxID=3096156 RepID=UPI002FCBF17E
MLRKSQYTIDVECDGYRVWINSLTGAIDRVPPSAGAAFADMGSDSLATLVARGHLTDLDPEQQRFQALEAWSMMDGVHRKKAKIVICPSMDCNFRCTYCFEAPLQARIDSGQMPTRAAHMTRAQVAHIFTSFDDLLPFNDSIANHITLFGGEPLWARNLDVVTDIVERARARSMTVSAVSNGYDLGAYRHLLGAGGIQRVQISLDGPAAIHDRMRPLKGGGANFDRIIANIDSAKGIPGFNIDIRMNYDSGNMAHATALHALLEEYGIIGRANVSFHANLISMNHSGDGKDYATIKQYEAVSKTLPDAELDCFTSGLRSNYVDALDTGAPLARRAHFCSATSGMYVYCPDDRIYSCWEGIGEEHSWIGTFGNGPIDWRMNAVRRWHDRTAPAMPKCQTCSHLFLCGGGCAVHAIEQTGDITVSQCDGIRKKFRYMVQKTMRERDPLQIAG